MVKLSQQLITSLAVRRGRTERLRSQQEAERSNLQRSREQAELDQELELKKGELESITSVEEYTDFYSGLGNNIRSYFPTPQEVRTQRTEQIAETRSKILQRLSETEQDLKNLELQKQQEEIALAKKNPSTEAWQRGLQEIDYRYNEKRRYLEGYWQGLNEGKGEIDSGRELSYSSVEEFASELGESYQSREKSKNIAKVKSQTAFQELKTSPFFESYAKLESENKGKIDWSNPENITAIDQARFVEKNQDVIAQKIALGEFDDPKVKEYERIVGEKKFETVKTQIKTEYDKQIKEAREEYIGQRIEENSIKQRAYLIPPDAYISTLDRSYNPITKTWDKIKKITKDAYGDLPEKVKGFVGSGYNKVSSADFQINVFDAGKYKIPIPVLPITPFKLSDYSSDIESYNVRETFFTPARDYLSKKSSDILEKEIDEKGIKKGIEEKYQEKYQLAFEDKYLRSLVYEEIDYDTAVKEFEGSEEAKRISEQYGKEIEAERNKLSVFTGSEWKIYGLNMANMGLWAIETPKKSVITAGVLYGGYGIFKLIPAKVGTGITAGFFGYGAYKTFSPKSTVQEKIGGVVTMAITGSSLAYQGIKYLKSPVVKTKTIEISKADLKTAESVGKNIKIITKDGVSYRVEIPSQKISQSVITGRRTLVTTRWRIFTNKFWRNLGVKPEIAENYIYKGIPYQNTGSTSYLRTFEGKYVAVKGQSDYEKALEKLMDYGYSKSQAQSTLRYYQPRVIEVYKEGYLDIKGTQATGQFITTQKQPVITLDKELGIKTRYAKPIQTVTDVERKLIAYSPESNIGVAYEEKTSILSILNKDNSIYKISLTKSQADAGIIFGKGTDYKQALLKAGKIDGINVYNQVEYQDITGVGISARKYPIDVIKQRIDLTNTKVKLFKEVRDLTKESYLQPKQPITKTPLSKTFQQNVEEIKKLIPKESKFLTTPSKPISAQQINTQTEVLQNVPTTQTYLPATKMKGITDVIQRLDSGIMTANIVSTIEASTPKDITKIDSVLKTKPISSDIIKEIDILKVDDILKVGDILKTPTKTGTGQITQSVVDFPISPIDVPMPNIPTIDYPVIKPPRFSPSFAFDFDFGLGVSKRKKKQKKKKSFEFAYLPDFTSRALGLDAEIISQVQAKQKLNKILTGLEIRRGVIIK